MFLLPYVTSYTILMTANKVANQVRGKLVSYSPGNLHRQLWIYRIDSDLL